MPRRAGIGLEQAGVELTEAGYIRVGEHLATTAPGVWAMGECAGSLPEASSGVYPDLGLDSGCGAS